MMQCTVNVLWHHIYMNNTLMYIFYISYFPIDKRSINFKRTLTNTRKLHITACQIEKDLNA